MPLKKMLVVDDEEDILFMYKAYFSRKGCEVFAMASGHEALEAYGSHPDMEMVLLDTDLVKEKGWQVYDLLRTAGYSGPVIALSGLGNRSEWRERNVPFAEKPITWSKLELKIQEVLGQGTQSPAGATE